MAVTTQEQHEAQAKNENLIQIPAIRVEITADQAKVFDSIARDGRMSTKTVLLLCTRYKHGRPFELQHIRRVD